MVNDRINIKYWHWFWLHDRENCSQFLWDIGTFIVNKYTRKWRHFRSVVRLIENCEGSTWKLVERKRLMKIDKWRHNFYSLLIIIIPLEEVQNFFLNSTTSRNVWEQFCFIWVLSDGFWKSINYVLLTITSWSNYSKNELFEFIFFRYTISANFRFKVSSKVKHELLKYCNLISELIFHYWISITEEIDSVSVVGRWCCAISVLSVTILLLLFFFI